MNTIVSTNLKVLNTIIACTDELSNRPTLSGIYINFGDGSVSATNGVLLCRSFVIDIEGPKKEGGVILPITKPFSKKVDKVVFSEQLDGNYLVSEFESAARKGYITKSITMEPIQGHYPNINNTIKELTKDHKMADREDVYLDWSLLAKVKKQYGVSIPLAQYKNQLYYGKTGDIEILIKGLTL